MSTFLKFKKHDIQRRKRLIEAKFKLTVKEN